MASDVDELLGSFSDSDYSVRVVNGVCKVVPFAPDLSNWFSLVEGLSAHDNEARKPVLDRARQITESADFQRALWMFKAIDTTGSGISAFSGVKSAVKMYQATTNTERLDALETDQQQAVDAVLKSLAIAFVVHKLFHGGPIEKIAAFRKTETGQAIIFYFASIEIGLPFADNAMVGGGTMLSNLYERFGPDQEAKLEAVTSPEEAAAAVTTMKKLMGPIDTMVKMASEHLKPIAEAAVSYLPTAMSVTDKVAGAAATGADVLPVWKYLGARLVAEVAIQRALTEQAEAKTEIPDAADAANVAIKFTRSADDLPAPPPKKRGCLFGLFGVILAIIGLGAVVETLG